MKASTVLVNQRDPISSTRFPASIARMLPLFAIAIFTGCAVPVGNHPYNESSLLAAAIENEDVFVIDVRTPLEYEQGHIPGAVNIPHDDIENHIDEIPKDRNIVVYCRSGHRAQLAMKILEEKGYSVYNFGGLERWDGEIVK